jgi:hypothetical protein
MFSNGTNGEKCSDEFWNFVNLMGHEIDLSNWNGYRGDMGKEGKTYADTWRGVQVIYHLAPMMGAEGHRRLIGNDVGVIFFLDPNDRAQFNPSQISELGQVPQVYGVVQPVSGGKFRLAFFHSVNLKAYGPQVGDTPMAAAEMKDLLLMKMYNGLVMTTYCPPLNRLFFIPRGQTLEAIVAEFPPDPKKSKKPSKVKDKAKLSNKTKADKEATLKIDGDELIPVSKGDFWIVDKKDSNSRKVYLGISHTQLTFSDQRAKVPLMRIPLSNLVRFQMRGSKAITFEYNNESGDKVDILFKAVSNNETLKINQQINSCLSKMFLTTKK